jgi:ABC-type multidrug transport system fused ATPase/permease subunit
MIFGRYSRKYLQALIGRDIAVDTFEKIHLLPYKEFSEFHSGDLVSRAANDPEKASRLVMTNFTDMISAVLTLILAIIYLVKINLFIAVVSIIIIPATLFIGQFIEQRMRSISKAYEDHAAKLRSILQEYLQRIDIAKVFRTAAAFLHRFTTMRKWQRGLHIRSALLNFWMYQMGNLITDAFIIIAVFFIALSAIRGQASIGEMTAYVYLLGQIQLPLMNITQAMGNMQQGYGAVSRIFSIFGNRSNESGHSIQMMEGGNYSRFDPNTPAVICENVSLWMKRDHYSISILKNINFQVSAGETVAIVGSSGSGKTSLARLLCGLYTASEGNMTIFGETQNENPRRFRSMIAYVPQTPILFPGTIMDNILLGRLDATYEEVIQAAMAANAHDFIMQLPKGYDTMVGEQGRSLSGGQKQRICIARALLANTPILILDEPTSALDHESERSITDTIRSLSRQKTIFIISHRLSTIIDADKIIVLNNGTIAGIGTHAELLSGNEHYSRLWTAQLISKDMVV